MNQNSISKSKYVSHQNNQSRGADDYLRQASYVPGYSYAATLSSVGGSYTHDMNKQVQAAPTGLFSSSPSGPMTGAAPQHHQPGLGGPVPTPQSTSMVPTQGQQLNARPHMAQMQNYSRQNTSRQVPTMSRSSITTVVSQSAPPTLQQYGTPLPLYTQQYTITPQATMMMSPHVISTAASGQIPGILKCAENFQNYQRSNYAAPHQFTMPSSQPMYIGNSWNNSFQPAVFYGQMPHMQSTCPPQIPSQMPPTQAAPKKAPVFKGIPIIDPATGRDVREDISNEPPTQGSAKDSNQSGDREQDLSVPVIFAAQVSQALAGDNAPPQENKAPIAEVVDDEDHPRTLPVTEDEIASEFPEQYNEQETVICTENSIPYYNRDSADINSISETVSIEKINSIISSEPVIVDIPQDVEYCNLNDTGKNEDDYSVSPNAVEIPCALESPEAGDEEKEKEKDSIVVTSEEIVNCEERKVPEETEVLPRPAQADAESISNSNSDDSGIFKHPAQIQKSQQPLKVKSQQNGDIHKTNNSVTLTAVSKEEKPSAEISKKKKKNKKDLNKRGESKEGGEMDAFLDKSEEVAPAAVSPQVQPQQPQHQQPLLPAAATTVVNRPDSPVTVSVQDSELPDSESEKVQQNDTSVICDQVQDSPTLSGEETDSKDIKESPVEETTKNQITLKYSYKEDQWSPLNPEGKKQYDREFLLNLQSQPMSMKKPSNLPNLDVIKDKATLHKLNEVNNRIASTATYPQRGGYDPFEPAFARTNVQGRPIHPGIKGRGSQQGRENKPPRKIILNTPTNQQVKLHTAEKAWTASRKVDAEPDDIRTQSLYKRVRGILNKLTPQKFQTLVTQVKQLDITTEESLNGVIDLVFEKAIDEPNFSVPYANMCKQLALLKVPSSGQEGQFVNFRKLLLTKCQREFEKDRTDEQNREERIRLIEESETEEKKKQLQEEFDEEERKNRRRQLGNIRFIGELFKLGMLTESIMHQCIKKLLHQGDEDSLECLCRLLTTIGKELENDKKPNSSFMENYFGDMKKVVDKRQTSSRVRFMLQDVIDLRMNNWVPRRDENNPKTIDQIHKEAEREAHEQHQMLQQMTFTKRMPDDRDRRKSRPPMSEDGWNMSGKSSKGNYSVDPMKLNLTKPAEVETISLGPGGKFSLWGKGSSGGAKSNIDQSSRAAPLQNRYAVLSDQGPLPYEARRSSQRSAASSRESSRGRNNQLPPPAVRKTPSVSRERDNAIEAVKSFTRTGASEQRPPSETRRPQEAQNVNGKDITAAALKGADNLTEEEIEKKTKPLIDEFLHNCDLEEAVRCVVELASPSTVCFLIHTAVNQVLERSSQSRHMLGKLLHALLKRKIITMEQYNKGLKDILEFSDDYALDIPLIWEYLGEIIEPILDDDDIGLGFLIDTLQPCTPSLAAGKLISAVLLCASKKRGTLRVGEMWKESKLSWTDFLKPDTDMEDFVKTYKMEFTVKQIVEPKLRKQITPEEVKQNVEKLLQDHESNEEIFNWLESNIEGEMSPLMYRALVTVICESTINGSGAKCEVNLGKLKQRMCILARYMDVNRNLELHAIFALQYLMNKLDHPKGVLLQIFDLAYNEDFLSDDAYKQWEHSNDPAEQEGKGVAIHSVSSFFTWLKEGEDDESPDGD